MVRLIHPPKEHHHERYNLARTLSTGHTDNFVSNEIIIPELKAVDVWPQLITTSAWPIYYGNASEIRFKDGTGPDRLAAYSAEHRTQETPVDKTPAQQREVV